MNECNTYHYSQRCENCGTLNSYLFPKGETIDDQLFGRHCQYCGCLVQQYSRRPQDRERFAKEASDGH